MKKIQFLLIIASTLLFTNVNSNNLKKNQKLSTYKETWKSLAKHNKEPDWFADAKLGIYFHWGPYSVPAFQNEWYPRWMYIKDARGWAPDVYAYGSGDWAKGVYDYHRENFGPQITFNYHDFIPMFTAEHFDAAEWVDLFEKAGARFAGPVAQHHDGFAMWASNANPWNVNDKGPQKDILGEIFEELEKRNMKTIATFHHARNLQRYANDASNWGGWNSHFPYHPSYATSTTDDELKYLYGNIPTDEFHEYWLEQIREVVNGYAPDIIWFDSWLELIPEDFRMKMVAMQYNAGAERGQETMVVYKQEDLPREVCMLDMEQAGMKDMSPDYWMTDITISYNSWSYVMDQKYKPADLLIRNMIDVWSKKGVVLLNISPRADGVINQEQREVLGEIGAWLTTYGEAVYNTRTHTVFGYGNAEIKEGFLGEGQSATQQYSASDVRFTRSKDGKTLYVFLLGMPDENSEIKIKHILADKNQKIGDVTLLESDAAVNWKIEGETLLVTTPPAKEMNNIATIFKVSYE